MECSTCIHKVTAAGICAFKIAADTLELTEDHDGGTSALAIRDSLSLSTFVSRDHT